MTTTTTTTTTKGVGHGEETRRSRASVLATVGAGLFAGGSSVLVGHPFDTLKTRWQVGKPLQGSGASGGSMVMMRELYRGILPPLLTTGLVQSVNFSLFEAFKRVYMRDTLGQPNAPEMSPQTYLGRIYLSSASAGALISLLTTPIGVLKTQQQVRTTKGLLACGKDLLSRYGPRVLYRGAMGGLIMEGLGRGVYMTTYETVKLLQLDAAQSAALRRGERPETSTRVKMVAAACAGTLGWISVYPVDTVKVRMMQDASGKHFPDLWTSAVITVREGGVARLYRGLAFSMVRAAPVASVVLPFYEITREFLERHLERIPALAVHV
ncbi:Carrier protein YMC1, mitochondrial [Hondaea fermentalgiana]|uniref:Carrier protein YMC1, mitochondrial n=1 Tax=Hondaea fermentalgiana TaxID=2315210 RepID=A0A2R5G8V8_9STRA|nr:Carrier protein YMC1, mitochondrial [Hondaea fermentalgiana]|eukprot:GBG27477.1 Carrier protein YMC1, mitochondrial [Hondaea fermentalgiana]